MKPLTRLPNATAWELLPPCAGTLTDLAERLAEAPAGRWPACLWADPGALLAALSLPLPIAPAALLQHLSTSTVTLADWHRPPQHSHHRFSQQVAVVAARLAEAAGENVPEVRAAALLSPLGSLVRVHQGQPFQSIADDHLHTRRLTRRWHLPAWLAATLLHLDLPVAPEQRELPTNRRLLLVQAAVAFVQQETQTEVLPLPLPLEPLLTLLQVDSRITSELTALLPQVPAPPAALPPEAAALFLRTLKATLPASVSAVATVEEVEAELEEMRSQLTQHRRHEADQLHERKLAALAEFAAGASHEINNPLAVISAQAQHLLKTEESLDRAKGLERIIGQANRIHTLLRDLLLYARPPQPTFRSSSIAKLVEAALDRVAEAAADREVHLETGAISARLKATVDAEMVTTALVCLLQNAIAVAPTQGLIRVMVETETSGSLAIVVEDNGPGVAEEVRPHLFDPFYSGHRAGRGTGLGLSKVWRIAQLHGGSISFDSRPPLPTRFMLRLPLSQALPHPRLAARTTRS